MVPINKQPSVVVTLVHGTFSSKKDFAPVGSPLRKEIASEFPDVHFEEFGWEKGSFPIGKGHFWNNAPRYRLSAGTRLNAQLHEAIKISPDAKHFIISHSHGGNVALYALRDETLAKRITGLICLATPFLVCDARRIDTDRPQVRWIIRSFGIFFTLLLCALLVGLLVGLLVVGLAFGGYYAKVELLPIIPSGVASWIKSHQSDALTEIVGFILIIYVFLAGLNFLISVASGAFQIVCAFIDSWTDGVTSWLIKKQIDVMESYRIPVNVRSKVWSAYTNKDEAYSFVSSLGNASELPLLGIKHFYPLLAFFAFCWAMAVRMWGPRDETQDAGGLILTAIVASYFASPFIFAILVVLYLYFSHVRLLAFGFEPFLNNLLVRMHAKIQLEGTQAKEFISTMKGTRHSNIVIEPAMLESMVKWMRSHTPFRPKGY